MKYLKKYESPDNVKLKHGIRLKYNVYSSLAFGYIEHPDFYLKTAEKRNKESPFFNYKFKNDFVLSDEYEIHPDILFNLGLSVKYPAALIYFDYAGRLWKNHKIISFWEYPETKEKLYNIIGDINSLSDDLKIDDSWLIEIYPEYKNKKEGKWDSDETELIPINEYEGSDNPSEEEYKQHVESPLNKKDSKIKSFGSKKPTNWKKWQKPFEKKKFKYLKKLNYLNQKKL